MRSNCAVVRATGGSPQTATILFIVPARIVRTATRRSPIGPRPVEEALPDRRTSVAATRLARPTRDRGTAVCKRPHLQRVQRSPGRCTLITELRVCHDVAPVF